MSPARPVTRLDKSDVLSGLFASWDAIDQVVGDLTDTQWSQPTALPGWTVHDVVAHVTGTESMLQGAGPPEVDVDVSTLEHVRNDIGVLNERWVCKLRGLSHAELLERFRATTAERREALTGMGEDQWHEVTMTPAGPDSYGRFMRVRTFDCFMHELDVRDAVGASPADVAGPHARLALDEMATSMGFVVGKLGKAPDGSRVRLELTGPLSRTINVAVDGRAKVVDEFDGEPTVTIALDGLLFTRLAGGRVAVAHDAVTYGGDKAVGRRIVEHLNYVI
ncbi:maleylpyruvate isomerase family mycothiol-dependent enzyme [Mycolicibacterium sp. 120270]|uniref:maleylpyruvate isomerase family mycothiol-dependent enzyme n=1 Tax=Mycolicibacterium sp. 120270 TaxID=3090600 RepID=UPI00299DB536|nr:maleylpyruvate isomerase family mycothiol-dependent enzyme [Mycolicibacterium sp. 120270]MDX1883886.1 maleylpyruvate isomerase family mycothiol-dependent enzyme [Mycolicibacterium sp. 120270]